MAEGKSRLFMGESVSPGCASPKCSVLFPCAPHGYRYPGHSGLNRNDRRYVCVCVCCSYSVCAHSCACCACDDRSSTYERVRARVRSRRGGRENSPRNQTSISTDRSNGHRDQPDSMDARSPKDFFEETEHMFSSEECVPPRFARCRCYFSLSFAQDHERF